MEDFEYFAHTTGGHLSRSLLNDSSNRQVSTRWSRESAANASRLIELFLRAGPILTPEIIDIPRVKIGNRYSEGFPVFQKRFCMTVVRHESDIARHMTLFGPITFCLKPRHVFMLGPISVSYIPSENEDEHQGIDSALGIVHRLREISSFLQEIDLLGFSQDAKVLRLVEQQRPEFVPILKMRRHLTEILQKLQMDRPRLQQLERTIHAVAHGLYPSGASSPLRKRYFEFFWEREWRIIAGLSLGESQGISFLSNELRNALLDINHAYFGASIERGELGRSFPTRMVCACRRLSPSLSDRFRDAIEAVYIDADLLNCNTSSFQETIEGLQLLHIKVLPIRVIY